MSENKTRRLEYCDSKSQKFWTITLKGKSHTVHFGRIGTNGQTKTKEFDGPSDAGKSFDKLVAQKLKKGYVDVVGSKGKTAKSRNGKSKKSKSTQGKAKKSQGGETDTKKAASNEAERASIEPQYIEFPDFTECASIWYLASALSRDGERLAVAFRDERKGTPTSRAHEVAIWDLVKQERIATIDGCSGLIRDLCFTSDGTRLICVGDAADDFMLGEIQIWETSHWGSRRIVENGTNPGTAAIFPNDKILVTGDTRYGGQTEKIWLWDITSGAVVKQILPGRQAIDDVAVSVDGQYLAAVSRSDGRLCLWDIKGKKEVWQRKLSGERMSVTFSPKCTTLASAAGQTIVLWDIGKGEPLHYLKRHRQWVDAMVFSPDGKMLVSGGDDTIRFWDVASGIEIGCVEHKQVKGRVSSIYELAYAADRRTIIAVHYNNMVSLWDSFAVADRLRSVQQPPAVAAHEPGSAERALLQAVADDVDSHEPRRAYSDWLDENGDPDRAQFIRVQIDLEPYKYKLGKPGRSEAARKAALVRKQKRLLKDNFKRWTAHLAKLNLTPEEVEFSRGFISGIRLRTIEITDDHLPVLQSVPTLENLDLNGSRVTNDGLAHLSRLKTLHWIDVSNTDVTPAGMWHLKDIVRLYRVYHFDWGNRPHAELEKFKQIRNDCFLSLPEDHRREEAIRALRWITDVGAVCVRLKGEDQVDFVSFSQSWATDADLVYLTALPEVRSLYFFECNAVTEKGLAHLKDAVGLEELEICESGVKSAEPLQYLTNLQSLELSTLEDFDEQSLRHLRPLKHLQKLIIRFVDNLTDAALPHIAALESLEQLELSEIKEFSDEGLEQLARLNNLKVLQLDYMSRRKDLVRRILDHST